MANSLMGMFNPNNGTPKVQGGMQGGAQGNNMMDILNSFANGSADPNALMQQISANNPQAGEVMNQVNQMISENGGNGEQVFMQMCKQKGIDANQIINTIKQFGIKI